MANKIEINLFSDHLQQYLSKIAILNQILFMKKYPKRTRNAIFPTILASFSRWV